jgi:hypothetical protein
MDDHLSVEEVEPDSQFIVLERACLDTDRHATVEVTGCCRRERVALVVAVESARLSGETPPARSQPSGDSAA